MTLAKNLLLASLLLTSSGFAAAQSAPYSFSAGSDADVAEIKSIVKMLAEERSDARIAANLDWENAFGIRYNDLKARDAFYAGVVKPLQKNDTDQTLEVKVRFIKPDVAVADEYWHIVGQLDVKTGKPGPDRWGRSTDIFVKQNGKWIEVSERIADLRLPYYKHLQKIPSAVALPPGTLDALAGNYVNDRNRAVTISVEGDHLAAKSERFRAVLVPQSATEFLAFRDDDFAEYYRAKVTAGAAGPVFTLEEAWDGDPPVMTLTRAAAK